MMKKLFTLIAFALFHGILYAQVSITNFTNPVTIDFNSFTGTGFTPTPAAGQLSSNDWSVLGMSDGALNFGDTQTGGDFARGMSNGGVTTGGAYSFNNGVTSTMLGVQSTGADFNPGHFILRIQNNTGQLIVDLDLSYVVWVFNDQNRSNTFNFSHSADNITYTSEPTLNLISVEVADASPVWEDFPKNIVLNGVNIANGDFYYLRWSSQDVAGSGSRDEFGLDDISILAVPTFMADFTAQDVCEGNAIQFNSIVLGGNPPYQYAWNFGDGVGVATTANPSYNYNNPGAYTVSLTVTDASLNILTVSHPVNVFENPIVVASIVSQSGQCAPATVCYEYTVTNNVTVATHLWDLGNGNTSTFPDPCETYGASGTYTATVVVTSTDGCVGMDDVTFNVIANDDPDFQYTPATYCISEANPSPTYIATSGGTFTSATATVEPNTGELDLLASGAGSHVIEYLTSGVCPATSSQTVTITGQLDASITQAGPYCEDDPADILDAVDAGGVWSGNGIVDPVAGEFDPSAAGAGIHTVVYAILGNCGDADSIQIEVFELPGSNFTGGFVQGDFVLNGINPDAASYLWTITDNGNVYTYTDSTFIYGYQSNTIEVCLEITNAEGCTSETCQTFTGLNTEDNSIQAFGLYPNPGNHLITVTRTNPTDEVVVTVNNIFGQKVSEFFLSEGVYSAILDVSELPNGTYLVQFVSGNKYTTRKFNKAE